MCPGFNSQTPCHTWIEFAVGSLHCSEMFFSLNSCFTLSSKTNISKFQFDPGMHTHFWTSSCELRCATLVNKLRNDYITSHYITITVHYLLWVPPSEACFLTLATEGGEGPSIILVPYKCSVVTSEVLFVLFKATNFVYLMINKYHLLRLIKVRSRCFSH